MLRSCSVRKDGRERMHYVTSDIHNDNVKFEKLLGRLALSGNDCLYILGVSRRTENENWSHTGEFAT